jgi:magnesium chelatase subunit D
MTDAGGRVAVAASVVAAAVRDPAGDLRPGDLRRVVSEAPRGRLVVVAVDASGSMAGRRRLDLARAAVLGLLGDAYRRRDRVAMVAFSGDRAEVVLRPTGSVEVARTRLGDVATGGTTPLAAGLRAVTDLVRTAARDGTVEPVAVIITDGRATSGGDDPVAASHQAAVALAATGARCVVLDAESGPVRLGLARELAAVLGADHVELDGSTGDAERAIRARLSDRSGAVP